MEPPPRAKVRKIRYVRKQTNRNKFDLPGVQKIIISSDAQEKVSCIVGVQVTSENPWVLVEKSAIVEYNDLYEELSDFWNISHEIENYPESKVLLGYIPDEEKDYDEFYICLSIQSKKEIEQIVDKKRIELDNRLENLLHRRARVWKNLKSDKEVDELIVQDHRSRISIELESVYPILVSQEPKFTMRLSQDTKDSYVEFSSEEIDPFNLIKRKRIDVSVQTSLPPKSVLCQTNSTYKTNKFTQHDHIPEATEAITDRYLHKVNNATLSAFKQIQDSIYTNPHINFYQNDYKQLTKNCNYVMDKLYFKAYFEFRDTDVCKGKQIADVNWHPLWSGTIAISYTNIISKRNGKPINEVQEIVLGAHPVLLWSLTDGLKAKLFFESPRDVTTLSFCPYKENILVGGMSNGQIIVWDLTNKLKNVEEKEYLNIDQLEYHKLMMSKMCWMKNVKDPSKVSYAAISNLKYSQSDRITAINWFPPHWPINSNGRLCPLDDKTPTVNIQFLTASLDGTVAIWDLSIKPLYDFEEPKKHKTRSKRRPSALSGDISPFRHLHKVLKPLYLLQNYMANFDRLIPISSSIFYRPQVQVEEISPDPQRKWNITDRILYKANVTKSQSVQPEIVLSTTEGHVITAKWSGYNYKSDQSVREELLNYTGISQFHDGPVEVFLNRYIEDVFLTVGGKVFAIWKKTFTSKPIFWRRSRHTYTSGRWHLSRPSTFRLCRSDGVLEIWQLFHRTDEPAESQSLSGKEISKSFVSNLPMKRIIMGVADASGSFRLFYLPEVNPFLNDDKENVEFWLNSQVEVKLHVKKWQDDWRKKRAAELAIEIDQKRREVIWKDEEKAGVVASMEKDRRKMKEDRRNLLESKPHPGHYAEWAQKKWLKKELESMHNNFFTLKALDKEHLEQQEKPLKILAAEAARRKKAKEKRQANSEKLFKETVAMMFPELFEKEQPPPSDPYAPIPTCVQSRKTHKKNFETVEDYCKTFVVLHRFRLMFDWVAFHEKGLERRKYLDGFFTGPNHKMRMERERRSIERLLTTSINQWKKSDQIEEDSMDFSSR